MSVAHIGKFQENTAALCKKWLRNSPGKRYQMIRICLTGEVETHISYPASGAGCEISGEDGTSQGWPSVCAWCRDPSGATPAGFPKRIRSALPYPDSLREKHTTLANITHPDDSISYPDMLSGSLTKVHKPCYVIPTACHSPCSAALRWCVRICLWQRTSKLRFFMFLRFPLLCHGFQRTLLNLGLLWWSKSYQNTKT